jgi:hypothetical protein
VQQIAVGAMYLQNVEVGLRRTTCALAIVLDSLRISSIVSDRGCNQPTRLASAQALTRCRGGSPLAVSSASRGPSPCPGRRRDAFGPR